MNDQLLIPLLCKHFMNVMEIYPAAILGYKGSFFTRVFVFQVILLLWTLVLFSWYTHYRIPVKLH